MWCIFKYSFSSLFIRTGSLLAGQGLLGASDSSLSLPGLPWLLLLFLLHWVNIEATHSLWYAVQATHCFVAGEEKRVFMEATMFPGFILMGTNNSSKYEFLRQIQECAVPALWQDLASYSFPFPIANRMGLGVVWGQDAPAGIAINRLVSVKERFSLLTYRAMAWLRSPL